MASIIIKAFNALRVFGFRECIKKMYMLGDIKFGTLIGVDKAGNKYYENRYYPYAQHRWVEYVDTNNFDASMISPEWHSWMHYTFDEPPSNETLAALPHVRTVIKSDVNFRSHIGGVRIQPDVMTNKTLWRSRGWGVGGIHLKPGQPDAYYLNPGHPLHPQSERHRYSRPGSVGVTADEEVTVGNAEAGKSELVKLPIIRRLSEW